MSKLLDLPSDILFDEIFARLSWPSISACLSTCTTLRNGINASPWLSYQKELYLSAMIDNPRSSVPLSEKIERLKTRERRWTQFTPRSTTAASVLDFNQGHYEVGDGLYILGQKEHDSPMMSILTWRLPTEEDDVHREPVWEGLTLDTPIIDCGLSVDANDLIVFACHTPTESNIFIDLRQWSTKRPHPLATCPILHTSCYDTRTSEPLACLRVCGDVLAGVFRYRDTNLFGMPCTRLVVWNWKTGQQFDNLLVNGTSLLFLREDVILVPNTSAFALDIYSISFNNSSDSMPHVAPILRLHFPAFASQYVTTHGSTYIRFCTAEPNLTQGSPQYLPSLRPFSADPAESVVYFNIHVHTPWRTSPIYDILVHHRTLLQLSLSCLDKRKGQDVAGVPPLSVQWEEWGPENCRMFDTSDFNNPFVRCASGTCFASFTPIDDETLPRQLTIYNFNRAKVRHAQIAALNGQAHDMQPETDDGTKTIRLVDRGERTVIDKSDLFKDDVVTALPYLCTTVVPVSTTDRVLAWDAGMLSEQCFIGTITGSSQSPFRPEKVDVLYFG